MEDERSERGKSSVSRDGDEGYEAGDWERAITESIMAFRLVFFAFGAREKTALQRE